MRTELTICNIGYTKSGYTLKDKDGNLYHWITKTKTPPIAYANRDEWFKVRATIINGDINKILKNVRIIK